MTTSTGAVRHTVGWYLAAVVGISLIAAYVRHVTAGGVREQTLDYDNRILYGNNTTGRDVGIRATFEIRSSSPDVGLDLGVTLQFDSRTSNYACRVRNLPSRTCWFGWLCWPVPPEMAIFRTAISAPPGAHPGTTDSAQLSINESRVATTECADHHYRSWVNVTFELDFRIKDGQLRCRFINSGHVHAIARYNDTDPLPPGRCGVMREQQPLGDQQSLAVTGIKVTFLDRDCSGESTTPRRTSM